MEYYEWLIIVIFIIVFSMYITNTILSIMYKDYDDPKYGDPKYYSFSEKRHHCGQSCKRISNSRPNHVSKEVNKAVNGLPEKIPHEMANFRKTVAEREKQELHEERREADEKNKSGFQPLMSDEELLNKSK